MKMTSRTGNRRNSGAPRWTGAFTLIELILVLALLTIVIALMAPSLGRFFHGRAIEEEGQRLLAMTRYAQSRAVSEGVPMELWMNPTDGSYGVRILEGFASSTKSQTGSATGPVPGVGKDVSYKLADKLRFDFGQWGRGPNQTVSILFAPDGSIGKDNPQRVVIRQTDDDWTAIVQSGNQMHYVIDQKNNAEAIVSR
jgi:Tfp pilus assembly protein FimT